MSNLAINPATRRQLEALAANPPHALLILGTDGVGKGSIASYLTSSLLGVSPGKLASYPYTTTIQPANSTISINAVRDVQKFLQLRTTGQGHIRRIVCLEHADSMTQEAQNALLKLVEEPPADTVIILTAQHKRALLPTILSRVQTVQIVPPTQQQLEEHFGDQEGSDAVRKAYFLSGGLPGLMQSILAGDSEHPLIQQVTVAKGLLQKPMFERLAMVDGLAKQKDTLDALLDALERIAGSGLAQAGKASNIGQVRQWHQIQKSVFGAKDALAKNANTKLVLTHMFLNL